MHKVSRGYCFAWIACSNTGLTAIFTPLLLLLLLQACMSIQQPTITVGGRWPTQSPPPPLPRRVRSSTLRLQSVSQEAVTAAGPTATQQPASSSSPQELHPQAWQECLEQVQQMGFAEADAAIYLQRAFGWGQKAKAYWRHEKVCAAALPLQIRPSAAAKFMRCACDLQCTPTPATNTLSTNQLAFFPPAHCVL